MNFFRSEEHLRNWEGFQEKKKGGIIALNTLMKLFSGPYFTNRGRPDYFSHMSEYMHGFLDNIGQPWRPAISGGWVGWKSSGFPLG